MKIAVTGASGLVGRKLSTLLTSSGHDVLPVSRSSGDGVVSWNLDTNEIEVAKLEGINAAVNLAGENIMGRWSSDKKRAILESRVKGTRLLCETLASLEQKPKVLVNASAMAIYGLRRDEALDESSALGKEGFLSDVCHQWEAATEAAEAAGIRVVWVRIGIVLATEGGLLQKLLPIFKSGLGGPIGDGSQRMSWITVNDLAGAIQYSIENEAVTGAVNGVAPNPVTNKAFTEAFGSAVKRPAVIPVPKFAVKLAMGEVANETAFTDLEIRPQRLLDAGFSFQHPTIDVALHALLKSS